MKTSDKDLIAEWEWRNEKDLRNMYNLEVT